MIYPCPTCGYPFKEPFEDSDICPSCGTQFGYSDSGRTYLELRESWVRLGAPWHSRVVAKPRGWNPWLQLIDAGYKYALPFKVHLLIQQPSGTEGLVSLAPPFYLTGTLAKFQVAPGTP